MTLDSFACFSSEVSAGVCCRTLACMRWGGVLEAGHLCECRLGGEVLVGRRALAYVDVCAC